MSKIQDKISAQLKLLPLSACKKWYYKHKGPSTQPSTYLVVADWQYLNNQWSDEVLKGILTNALNADNLQWKKTSKY